jgi:hypothetical protein
MPGIRKLVYVSAVISKFTPAELDQLLTQSRENNAAMDATGLLVYSDGNVMQVIEGPAQSIETLFGKIAQDPRHRQITKLVDIEVDKRDFEQWRMAFIHEPKPEVVENCVNLLRSQQAL